MSQKYQRSQNGHGRKKKNIFHREEEKKGESRVEKSSKGNFALQKKEMQPTELHCYYCFDHVLAKLDAQHSPQTPQFPDDCW